jgi:hypothetical protein
MPSEAILFQSYIGNDTVEGGLGEGLLQSAKPVRVHTGVGRDPSCGLGSPISHVRTIGLGVGLLAKLVRGKSN